MAHRQDPTVTVLGTFSVKIWREVLDSDGSPFVEFTYIEMKKGEPIAIMTEVCAGDLVRAQRAMPGSKFLKRPKAGKARTTK
jgi:hypothetical protein